MPKNIPFESEFYANSEILPELTTFKIRDILLVSSLYNIFHMEEGGLLASQINKEYKGLRLENPPRITGVSSTEEAMVLLKEKEFNMVIIVPHLDKLETTSLCEDIKKLNSTIPIILLSQNTREISTLLGYQHLKDIDGVFSWFGNSDLLLAIVKNAEDHRNVKHDTSLANVRVLVYVEDSPDHYSHLLPIFYKEIVNQTQALMEVGLTEKQRALTLRQRPKILLCKTYEEGLELCRKYQDYLFCVVSDTRIPRNNRITADGGLKLLMQLRSEVRGLPLLLMSSERANKQQAKENGLAFIDKDSPNLLKRIHSYFLEQLGFGEFIFRTSDGKELGRAGNFLDLEELLKRVSGDSIAFHASQHHFSRWTMARCEISLAMKFKAVHFSDFKNVESLREFLITHIHTLRQYRQRGVVSQYHKRHFDAEIREFVKIGFGALGGKARGLAFMSDLFRQHDDLHKKHHAISIKVPKTLVICTDLFDSFVSQNNLRSLLRDNYTDEEVSSRFLKARLPDSLIRDLHSYLEQVRYPLSIRSSSQMEDAHHQPYAGLYKTYMIPNNHPNLSIRFEQLVKAIKLVYASTYFESPRSYSKSISNQHIKESMAVIIQQLTGEQHEDHFYPAISGIAQSFNYYPFGKMKAEEGVVHMALGLGKTVVEGEKCIRFSPHYPEMIPEFSNVADTLKNTQKSFYALKMKNCPVELQFQRHSNLEKRSIADCTNETPVRLLSSTYIANEDRIRDSLDFEGAKVLTFARILKYDLFGIPTILSDLLKLGEEGFGCPVEIEFSANINPANNKQVELYFLQIRPMFANEAHHQVDITEEDIEKAFCISTQALGNGVNSTIADIVYIKPNSFKKNATRQIAEEIERINAKLEKQNRFYLLAGPGRWGGSDRWLGIPVRWHQISSVGAIVELRNKSLCADPSQGSHFFQNITSLGIHYIMLDETVQEVSRTIDNFFDWDWVDSLPSVSETEFVRHVSLQNPLVLKLDGRTSKCVMLKP